jgi:ribosomal protein L11 methyltransferase
MDWRQFVMDLETLNSDRVEEIFTRHGAQSITYTDAGDKPVLEPAPGETPMWSDTRICGLFTPDADLATLQDDLKAVFQIDVLPAHEITELENRAWEREWLRDFGPMRFGERVWICPGDSVVNDTDAVVVRLDPGLAFGTGTHATTALCLEWLDSLPLDGKSMLDYGCGSGVLAIAALKLGCSQAVATDIDRQAFQATNDNAIRNDVQDKLAVMLNADDVNAKFDVVVANILAGPLIELAESIAGRVKSGCLLGLSGILSEQVGEVLEAYEPWIAFDDPVKREQGGQVWARLTGRRTEG